MKQGWREKSRRGQVVARWRRAHAVRLTLKWAKAIPIYVTYMRQSEGYNSAFKGAKSPVKFSGCQSLDLSREKAQVQSHKCKLRLDKIRKIM